MISACFLGGSLADIGILQIALFLSRASLIPPFFKARLPDGQGEGVRTVFLIPAKKITDSCSVARWLGHPSPSYVFSA